MLLSRCWHAAGTRRRPGAATSFPPRFRATARRSTFLALNDTRQSPSQGLTLFYQFLDDEDEEVSKVSQNIIDNFFSADVRRGASWVARGPSAHPAPLTLARHPLF